MECTVAARFRLRPYGASLVARFDAGCESSLGGVLSGGLPFVHIVTNGGVHRAIATGLWLVLKLLRERV